MYCNAFAVFSEKYDSAKVVAKRLRDGRINDSRCSRIVEQVQVRHARQMCDVGLKLLLITEFTKCIIMTRTIELEHGNSVCRSGSIKQSIY